MKYILSIVIAMFISSVNAGALSNEFTETAESLAECSAYFQIVSECTENTDPGSNTASGYAEISVHAARYSSVVLSIGIAQLMSEANEPFDLDDISTASIKAAHQKYEIHKAAMLNEIVACPNISILVAKYMADCGSLYIDAKSYLDE